MRINFVLFSKEFSSTMLMERDERKTSILFFCFPIHNYITSITSQIWWEKLFKYSSCSFDLCGGHMSWMR